MRGQVTVNARRKQTKSYFPFSMGMRGQKFVSGANYQYNLLQNNGILEKVKQLYLTKNITDFAKILYITEYVKPLGDVQAVVFGETSSGDIKLRAVEADGTVITPGTEVITTLTGTADSTSGSDTLSGTSTLFTTELSVGDEVGLDPGDGQTYIVEQIVSDTSLKFNRAYVGSSITGSDLKLYTNKGGIGDGVFYGTVTARQIGTKLLIGHKNGAYTWDGEATAPISGLGSISIARDGARLGYITPDGNTKFTDNDPVSGFTGGTGANADGDYNSGISFPTAIVEGGTGVIIFGKQKAEAHWVQPNSASDEVSSQTKIESFRYLGKGVSSERFVVSTGNSVGFMNEDGVFLMDPYSGKVTNLIIGGKIERYWKDKIDHTSGFMAFDQENNILIAQVSLDSSQNNVFLAFDLDEKGTPPSIIGDKYLQHASIVDGKLVGGSSSTGDIYKLFYGFSTPDGGVYKSRYITEFDGLGALQSEKNLIGITFITETSPEATLKLRAYFDNETEYSLEKTITTKDLTTNALSNVYGRYVFAIGASDLVNELVIRGERYRAGMRFNTIAIEIIEESDADFKIYDIMVEYLSSNRISKTMSLKNNLF